ncbi:MAG: prepilin-type N-terminal cleavage/methylation domain-containing protein, partial [Candidatus Omnitrophica bacterium]|nr:prepilin-type N-terminal cleavage/methylation domain-containing protein [Candidatus Omnitrophota bacterium]
MKKSFTMVELVIVMIIVGLLATFAVPTFGGAKERAYDNEAKASLKLIVAAQKIYRMETSNYASGPNTATLNSNLKLSLPTSGPWAYSWVTNTALATRTSGSRARGSWRLSVID